MEKLNEGLTFNILLENATNFIAGKMTLDELSDWGNTILIRAYISSIEKTKILMRIVNDYSYSGMELKELIVAELYKFMFFRLYLEGYLGIEDISSDDITYENYDILNSVYGPWIEGYAQRDINLFKDMLKDTISFYSLDKFSHALEMVDYDKLSENAESNRELVNKLDSDKEMIENLRDLTLFNNPLAKDLVEKARALHGLTQEE